MKTMTYPSILKTLVVTGSLVALSLFWLSGAVEAKAESSQTFKACSDETVLDKSDRNLDMKLMVHRTYAAPVIFLTDI